jgi:restriction system protein
MSRPLSRSDKLITDMHHAALVALAESQNGQLRHSDLMAEIERNVPLDDWAREIYESSGNTRWRAIFAFSSVGLVKAGYVSKSRGVWTLLDEGRDVLAGDWNPREYLQEIDRRYKLWKAGSLKQPAPASGDTDAIDRELSSPEERVTAILSESRDSVAAELLDLVKQCEPAFFEKLVVRLLLRMGYGGSQQEAGRAVGRSGDGGIDGIIDEDKLGLDAIYIQAKRWQGSVGEGPIRDFKGALDAKNAHKGVFITTGTFTPAAIEAAKNSRYKIVLVDGVRLAQLLLDYDIGVEIAATFTIKRVDRTFFEEE